jgi:lysozyme
MTCAPIGSLDAMPGLRLGAAAGGADPAPPRPDPRGPLAALIGVPAAAALLAAIAGFEGYAPEPYDDPAGVPTVCWGDTQHVARGRTYSRAECGARLERQAAAHVAPVLRCVPQLRGREGALIASASLAYNIGAPAFCRSTAARRFRAGDWQGGCDAFLVWDKARVNGRLVPLRGLANRRRAERAICLGGLARGAAA